MHAIPDLCVVHEHAIAFSGQVIYKIKRHKIVTQSSIRNALAEIDGFKIPFSRADVQIVAAKLWPQSLDLESRRSVVSGLDEFCSKRLPNYFEHPGASINWCGLPGDGRYPNDGPPDKSDYENEVDFVHACDVWEDHLHETSPWTGGDRGIAEYMLKHQLGLNCLNEKDPKIKQQFNAVDKLLAKIKQVVTKNCQTWFANQLLDNPRSEHWDWIGYHDEVTAIVDKEFFILLYFGYVRQPNAEGKCLPSVSQLAAINFRLVCRMLVKQREGKGTLPSSYLNFSRLNPSFSALAFPMGSKRIVNV